MNLSDFATEGQIWSGIKQAAGGVGSVVKGVGNVLGGVGSGVVKGLDILGGGSGDVGTEAQRAERKSAEKQQQLAAEIKAYDNKIPTYAITEFLKQCKARNIDVNNDKTYDRQELLNLMKTFAFDFFANDPGWDHDTRILNQYMVNKLQDEPLPNTINKQSISNYFTAISHAKKIGLTNLIKASEQVAARTSNQMDALAQEISAEIRSGRRPAKNLVDTFMSTDKLQQDLYRRGIATAARTDLQTLVMQMLFQPEDDKEKTGQPTAPNKQQTTTVPPAPPGMVNTVTIKTTGGDRKFFIDKRDQWYEYMGNSNNWPKEIELSRPVVEDDVIDYLAKQVADGRVRQEPYGTKRRKK